jgi:hypothetical protein
MYRGSENSLSSSNILFCFLPPVAEMMPRSMKSKSTKEGVMVIMVMKTVTVATIHVWTKAKAHRWVSESTKKWRHVKTPAFLYYFYTL